MKTSEPSYAMKVVFLLSILLMGVHKIESFYTREWEFAPIYLYFLNQDYSRGEIIFLSFVVTLFVGLAWVWIIISFRAGKWIFLGFWGLTFFEEWHHLIRTYHSGQYYTGLFSAILYGLFGIVYWSVFLTHFFPRSRNNKPKKTSLTSLHSKSTHQIVA
jgi:hypothetical protein